jgi:hypothetical protein
VSFGQNACCAFGAFVGRDDENKKACEKLLCCTEARRGRARKRVAILTAISSIKACTGHDTLLSALHTSHTTHTHTHTLHSALIDIVILATRIYAR